MQKGLSRRKQDKLYNGPQDILFDENLMIVKKVITRQVYNGPRTSNLSQQQKRIFGQK